MSCLPYRAGQVPADSVVSKRHVESERPSDSRGRSFLASIGLAFLLQESALFPTIAKSTEFSRTSATDYRTRLAHRRNPIYWLTLRHNHCRFHPPRFALLANSALTAKMTAQAVMRRATTVENAEVRKNLPAIPGATTILTYRCRTRMAASAALKRLLHSFIN